MYQRSVQRIFSFVPPALWLSFRRYDAVTSLSRLRHSALALHHTPGTSACYKSVNSFLLETGLPYEAPSFFASFKDHSFSLSRRTQATSYTKLICR